jgi:hypothetical protein
MLTRALALTTLLGTVACASEGGAFLPGDDPGTGTSTLEVTATAVATPRFLNAGAGDEYDTAFRVVVQKADVRVTMGVVTVGSVAGTLALTFDTRDGGAWIGVQAGYHEIYVLDVVSGADLVSDVRIDGPDLHTFTAPMQGALVDATLPLAVTWVRRDTATAAALHTRGGGDTEVPDTGAFTIPPGGLASAPDLEVEEELRLDRMSKVVPAGGAPGSTWSCEVRNFVKLRVASTGLPQP